MKKKTFQINIPEPCNERWATMDVQEKGRFCQKCSRTIVDFTTKSDFQIAQAFANAKGQLCGRFCATQVGRNIAIETPVIRNARLKAAGLLLSGLLSTPCESPTVPPSAESYSELQNQDPSKVNYGCAEYVERTDELREKIHTKEIPQPKRYVDGVMKNVDDRCMAFFHFQFQNYSYVTNHRGEFRIPVDSNIPELVLITNEDYENVILDVAACTQQDVVTITLLDKEERMEIMGMLAHYDYNEYYSAGELKALIEKEENGGGEGSAPYWQKKRPILQVGKASTLFTPAYIDHIFPREFNKQINVALHSSIKQTIHFVLTDEDGMVVHSQQAKMKIGLNITSMDINPRAGRYTCLLSIYQGGEVVQTRMLSKNISYK